MKKNDAKKSLKLQLHRETLLALEEKQLSRIAGDGTGSNLFSGCNTVCCPNTR